MFFEATSLEGVFIIQLDRKYDTRGFFARSWCQKEFEAHQLNTQLVQCNLSSNALKGTLRGMHYQVAPHQEAKTVRCIKGKAYDVVIDLRPNSPTFKQHFSTILSAENHTAVYIPEGCAHGFQTLEDETELFYQMSNFYHPQSSRGVRWNDPVFNIVWPLKVTMISENDQNYPDFS